MEINIQEKETMIERNYLKKKNHQLDVDQVRSTQP
jgi:hypothetical protein